MVKVTVSGLSGGVKTCVVSETETPNKILLYYNADPNTKIVYMNGMILSREKMASPLPNKSPIFMIVRNKTVIRD